MLAYSWVYIRRIAIIHCMYSADEGSVAVRAYGRRLSSCQNATMRPRTPHILNLNAQSSQLVIQSATCAYAATVSHRIVCIPVGCFKYGSPMLLSIVHHSFDVAADLAKSAPYDAHSTQISNCATLHIQGTAALLTFLDGPLP